MLQLPQLRGEVADGAGDLQLRPVRGPPRGQLLLGQQGVAAVAVQHLGAVVDVHLGGGGEGQEEGVEVMDDKEEEEEEEADLGDVVLGRMVWDGLVAPPEEERRIMAPKGSFQSEKKTS